MDCVIMNGKEFLKYLIEKCPSNLTFIKSLRLNKKSISITMDAEDSIFIWNDFFTREHLYNIVISYLSAYIRDNKIDHPNDKDYLKYKYSKLNINYR